MLKSLLNSKNLIYILIILAVAILIIVFIITYRNATDKVTDKEGPPIKATATKIISINTAGTTDLILEDIQPGENLKSEDAPLATSTPKVNSSTPLNTSALVTNNNNGSPVQITVTPPLADTPPPLITPPQQLPTSITQKEIMAWIYPGATSCNASSEYSDGRKIHILKPEYFTINEEGALILLTVEERGCNGYSTSNVESVRKHSNEQYATISSSYAGSMDLFLTESLENSTNIDTLVSFTVNNKITGLEIDFEDFGGWSAASYQKYKEFITKLGNALHANNKKLMIDGPATSNSTEEAWYVWRYADFNNLPVDKLVIMLYDYHYDHGVGQPVAPLTWIQETIKFTLGKFPNKAKLSIGVPSYGYRGVTGSNRSTLLTYNQIKKEPGFANAKRDSNSFEMTWEEGGNTYFYQDAESLVKKIQTIKDSGIDSISIWHLGGNLWF